MKYNKSSLSVYVEYLRSLHILGIEEEEGITKLIIDSYYKSNNIKELITLLQLPLFKQTSSLAKILVNYDNKQIQDEGISIYKLLKEYRILIASLLKLHRVNEAMSIALQCKKNRLLIPSNGADFFKSVCELVEMNKDISFFYTLQSFYKRWFPPLIIVNPDTKKSLLAETVQFPTFLTGESEVIFKMLFGFP